MLFYNIAICIYILPYIDVYFLQWKIFPSHYICDIINNFMVFDQELRQLQEFFKKAALI
jgi:hypothetical protein